MNIHHVEVQRYVAFHVHVEGNAQPSRIDLPLTGSEVKTLDSRRPEDREARRVLEAKIWEDYIRHHSLSGETLITFSRLGGGEFTFGVPLEGVPLEAAFLAS